MLPIAGTPVQLVFPCASVWPRAWLSHRGGAILPHLILRVFLPWRKTVIGSPCNMVLPVANCVPLAAARDSKPRPRPAEESTETPKRAQERKNPKHNQAASSTKSLNAVERDASVESLAPGRDDILSRLAPPLTPHTPRRPSAAAKALVAVPEQQQASEGAAQSAAEHLSDKCAAEKFSTQDYIKWLRSKFDVALDEAPYIHPSDEEASKQVCFALSQPICPHPSFRLPTPPVIHSSWTRVGCSNCCMRPQAEAQATSKDIEKALIHARVNTETKIKALETKVESLLVQLTDAVAGATARLDARSTALIVQHDMLQRAQDVPRAVPESPRTISYHHAWSMMEPEAPEPTLASQAMHRPNENVPAHKPSAGALCAARVRTQGMRARCAGVLVCPLQAQHDVACNTRTRNPSW